MPDFEKEGSGTIVHMTPFCRPEALKLWAAEDHEKSRSLSIHAELPQADRALVPVLRNARRQACVQALLPVVYSDTPRYSHSRRSTRRSHIPDFPQAARLPAAEGLSKKSKERRWITHSVSMRSTWRTIGPFRTPVCAVTMLTATRRSSVIVGRFCKCIDDLV